MEVIVIGSSVAGASLAYLLARSGIEVKVYESKSRKDVGKKVCANVYTFMIKDILKDFSINPQKLIKNHYSNLRVFSKNNQASFMTEEYEFDRSKLLETLIRNAEKKGAKFIFNANFIDFSRKNEKFILKLKKEKPIVDSCDVLVGADGALSEVAKRAGLWQNRKFFLTLQARVSKQQIKNKKYIPPKNSYNILLGEDYGYYSYIFSSKEGFVVGLGDRPEKNVRKEFGNLLKFLNIKKARIEGALFPEPKVLKLKKGIFLIGDAGCQIKFNGGGVIPAFMAARAIKEILVKGDWKDYNKMNSRIRLNRIAVKFFEKMSDKRADNLLDIVKEKKFEKFPKYRDYLSKEDLRKLFSPGLMASIIRMFI
jgi:flavin-dependent dehydrogenase